MRRTLLFCLVLAAALLVPSSALAAPTVTLTDPADGALITGGQPTFSGSAGDAGSDTGVVTINIYAGTTSTNEVVTQVLTADVSNGGYSATATNLPDGTYTAVASESDTSGNTGSSDPVTFQLFNGTPGLTLTAPSPPILTPAPTFTGTAQTGSGGASTVDLAIYAGSGTDSTPVEQLSGTESASGGYSIQVLPGLANGSYTAVASQQLSSSTTFSASVGFSIATTAPPLTLTSPSANASEPQTGVDFGGAAGDEYGDTAISLTLYQGSNPTGTPLGTATVNPSGDTWSDSWGSTLALGTYTLVASQSDTAAQTTTITRTFSVAAPGSISGSVAVSKTGIVSTKLSCLTGAGTCEGDVLILTTRHFQPLHGGPRGPLALMFDHYAVAAASTKTLTARLTAAQLAALRHAGTTSLLVTVAYSVGSTLTEHHESMTVKVA